MNLILHLIIKKGGKYAFIHVRHPEEEKPADRCQIILYHTNLNLSKSRAAVIRFLCHIQLIGTNFTSLSWSGHIYT